MLGHLSYRTDNFNVALPNPASTHGPRLRRMACVRFVMRLIDSTKAQALRLAKPGWEADSVLAHLDAKALSDPFVHGSPTLAFFLDQYFLNPFVERALATDSVRRTATVPR